MSERKSAKIHYVISRDTGYTFCGRYVTMTLQVSRDAAEVTCATCLRELADPARKLAPATTGTPDPEAERGYARERADYDPEG